MPPHVQFRPVVSAPGKRCTCMGPAAAESHLRLPDCACPVESISMPLHARISATREFNASR
eukprot:14254418-Alexandrium_andersonii.AAC.1